MTQFAIASISDIELDFIYDSVARERAAIEDEMMLRERMGLRVEGDPSSHPVWRSPEVALTCTKRLVRIARETGARVHILHISTGEEMVFLKDHKDVATVEVLPNHLTLVAPDCYERLGTYAQMNPPVRDRSHWEAIWAGVREGVNRRPVQGRRAHAQH